MMKRTSMGSKIVVAAVTLVLVGLLAFCAWWLYKNGDKVQAGLDGTAIYTQQEYDEAYNQGVDDGALLKTEQERLIANLKKQVDNLNTVTNALRADIAQKDAQISAQTTQVTQDASTIASLQAEITRLNGLVASMQQDIDFYIAKIAEFKTENEVAVYFVLDEAGAEIHYTKIVDKGTTLGDDAVPAPANSAYKHFVGWSLDKTNVVSISAQAIEQDTTFFAVWENVAFDVVFQNYDGTELSRTVVAKGSSTTPPSNPSHCDTDHAFAYWTPDGGVTKLYSWSNVTSYTITQETIFVATFREIDAYIKLVYNGTLVDYVEEDDAAELLAEQNLSIDGVYLVISGWFGDEMSGGFELAADEIWENYEIVVTSTDTQVLLSFAGKNYTYTRQGDYLELYIESKSAETGYKNSNIDHDMTVYFS